MATYDPATYEQEIERHFQWNFVVNSLDGAFFWFAMTFASTSTILPVYVSRLTDSPLLIGLVQTIPGFGWLVPQLFTAPLVERMSRKKPYFIWVSLAGERAAFLVMALGAFFLSVKAPRSALIVFYVALIWHAFGAGMIATAWQELVAKIIPFGLLGINMASYLMSGMSITFEFSEPEVRPTYIGLASTTVGLFSGLSPILGGWLAGVVGYVWLFAICLIILLVSWAMLHWWVVDPRFAVPDARPGGVVIVREGNDASSVV